MQETSPLSKTRPDTPIIDIDQASVMRQGKLIVNQLSLTVAQGQHTAIIGPNGAGKSTLVKLLARQIYPLVQPNGRGKVHIFGRNRWKVSELRKLIGIVSPSVERDYTSDADAPIEVFDAVVSSFFAARGLHLDNRATVSMNDRAHAALRQLDATHLIGRDMGSLSSGEARRVMIARALVHRPRALLLDEPCAGLDMASRRYFLEKLRHLAQEGVTLILITHHIEEILPEINHILLLENGRALAQGTKADTLKDDKLSATFGIPIHVDKQENWYHARIDQSLVNF